MAATRKKVTKKPAPKKNNLSAFQAAKAIKKRKKTMNDLMR